MPGRRLQGSIAGPARRAPVRNPLAEAAAAAGRGCWLGAAASGKASATSMAPASGLDGAGLSDTRNAGHPILPPPESSVEWDAWAGAGNAAAIRMATRMAAVAVDAALLPALAITGRLIAEDPVQEVVQECVAPRIDAAADEPGGTCGEYYSFDKTSMFIGGKD